jgi:hypothetical protein
MKALSIVSICVIVLLISCNVSKTHTWANKKVTEKKYNRKLNRHTKRFVRKMPDDIKRLFLEVEFVYDTAKNLN